MIDWKEVGGRIRRLREAMGYSQEDLGVKLGYATGAAAKTSVNKAECGRRSLGQHLVEKYAMALNVSPMWLVGWSDIPNEPWTPTIDWKPLTGDTWVERAEGVERRKAKALSENSSKKVESDPEEAALLRYYRRLKPETKEVALLSMKAWALHDRKNKG